MQQIRAQFPQLNFENLTIANGLSDNIITCIYEDKEGFLWIGTSYGLNRYDGNYFQRFYNEDGNANSLSGNVIIDVIEDMQGIFWIATRDGGLTRYDPMANRDKQFMQFKNDTADSNSIISNRMTALTELNEDFILISCENMMIGFVNKHNYKITYASVTDSTYSAIDPRSGKNKPDNLAWVQCFKSDADHIYFSKLGASLIEVYNKKTKQKLPYKANVGGVRNFLVEDDSIWLVSWNQGLFVQKNPVYSSPGEYIEQIPLGGIEDEILMLQSFNNKILMAATKTSGLFLIDKHTHAIQKVSHDRSNNNSIASNRVNCLLKDSRGIVWVGTTAGLSKYNPVLWQFNAYELNNNYEKDLIHFSIFSYNDSVIGICTSNGIYKNKIGTGDFELQEIIYEGTELNPTGMFSLGDNKYYLNTESGTFYFNPNTNHLELMLPEADYNMAAKKFTTGNPLIKGSYQVYNTIFDTINGQPFHFFSTIGWGLGIYNETEDRYYDLCRGNGTNSISSNFVRVIFKDAEKNIWVGTSEGLNKWNKTLPVKNEFTRYFHLNNDNTTISNNTITGLYEDKNKQLWISTGNGLNKFENGKFIHYKNPVSELNQMYGIYPDEKGNFWIAVRGGFELFDPDAKTFRYVPLPVTAWSLKNPATIYRQKGEGWFYGAGNYLIRFDPDRFYFETAFPKIYLNGFAVFENQIFRSEAFNDLEFNHADNFITIEFSSIQLSQPSTVKYKYQLAGLNNDWIENGNSGKIIFTSLPPGHYTLNVKVTNPLGTWSAPVQIIEFTILNPYWQQWWFILLCLLAILLAVFAVIKIRERQLKKLYAIRNKIANDLHDDVGSALSTINLYSEVAKMKSLNENDEVQHILDKISTTSIEMQENMNQIVWSLQPRNDNFNQMILRMKSFALENLQTKNIVMEFIVDEKLDELKISAEKRNQLFLIYKEAIHNIVKYANCSEVKILFQKINADLQMTITDNGQGFETDNIFSGNGLHTMQERTKQLKGRLEILSAPGKGTEVRLSFKI